jgi:hypothetical protein
MGGGQARAMAQAWAGGPGSARWRSAKKVPRGHFARDAGAGDQGRPGTGSCAWWHGVARRSFEPSKLCSAVELPSETWRPPMRARRPRPASAGQPRGRRRRRAAEPGAVRRAQSSAVLSRLDVLVIVGRRERGSPVDGLCAQGVEVLGYRHSPARRDAVGRRRDPAGEHRVGVAWAGGGGGGGGGVEQRASGGGGGRRSGSGRPPCLLPGSGPGPSLPGPGAGGRAAHRRTACRGRSGLGGGRAARRGACGRC